MRKRLARKPGRPVHRPDAGEYSLLCAVFDLAWADVRKGNGHAEDARAFLRSGETAEWLEDLCGVDAGYYARVIGEATAMR